MTGLYADPHLYDILHQPGTDREARVLLRLFRRFASGAPEVALEPACGSGRYVCALARLGLRARGFDLSPAMVRYARARSDAGGLASFFVASFESFAARVRAGSIGLAFCPINSVRHVRSDREMVRHLRAVRDVMHPCGVYVVGLSLSAYGLEAPSEDVWTATRREGASRVRVRQVVSYTPAPGGRGRGRQELVHSVLEITRGRRVEVRGSSYTLHAFSRAQWEGVVRRAGLRLIASVDEAGRDHDPGLLGYAQFVLARRDHPLAG